VFELAELPAMARKVLSAIVNSSDYEDDPDGLHMILFNNYGQAMGELEEHLAARGKALVSIDATEGDTMFFALLPEEVAARWRNRAMIDADGYRAGVRPAMWDRFWAHLCYALDFDDSGGYPPGTRMRDNDIPMIGS
jgi:hypothetical protein